MTMENESEQDTWAREHGFLVLAPDEAYELRVTRTASIFVYQIDNGRWIAVYDNTWSDAKGRSNGKQFIRAGASKDGAEIYGTTWAKAAERAQAYAKQRAV